MEAGKYAWQRYKPPGHNISFKGYCEDQGLDIKPRGGVDVLGKLTKVYIDYLKGETLPEMILEVWNKRTPRTLSMAKVLAAVNEA